MRQTKHILLVMDFSQYEALAELSRNMAVREKSRVSVNEVIRRAIGRYLEGNDPRTISALKPTQPRDEQKSES